jgi:hypothetical protein
MKMTICFFFLLVVFASSDALAQSEQKVGDAVEVTNIGRGVIVGGYQRNEWNYGTYQVHMDGEKYCNNHVLDTRYHEKYVLPLKKAASAPKAEEKPKAQPAAAQPAAGDFHIGDTVLYAETSIWGKGVIKGYDAANRRYTLQDVYVGIPCHSVARTAKTYNNDFFLGAWNVHLSGANYTTVENGKVFDNVSGGLKLFPLQVRKDGTYSWKLSAKKTLAGRWKPREDAPGIVILNGIDGKDWTVYETTEGFATTKDTKDEIRFHHMPTHTGYYLATRIGPNKSCLLTGRTFK